MAETEILGMHHPMVQRPASEHPEVKYATGLSLLGLTSGLVAVDSLIGGLKPDTIALLTGSERTATIVADTDGSGFVPADAALQAPG